MSKIPKELKGKIMRIKLNDGVVVLIDDKKNGFLECPTTKRRLPLSIIRIPTGQPTMENKIKQVTNWITSDNMHHQSQEAAEKHEKLLELNKHYTPAPNGALNIMVNWASAHPKSANILINLLIQTLAENDLWPNE